MSVRKGDKIIAGSYAIIKPDVYTKEESDELLALKQNKLIAGDNIYIDEETNVISSIGGGMSINVVQTTGTSIDDVMSQSAVTRELEQKIEVEDVAEVALSGKYEDLINKPDLTLYTKTEDLSDVAFTGDYNDLSNIPDYPAIDNLAKVATTNDYNDLDNTPNLTIYDTILSVDRKLELKQNKLTAGQGIIIEDDTISTNVNSAEWGNITGDINAQEDLQNIIQEGLNSKLDTDFDNITEDGISNLRNIVNNGTAMFDIVYADHILSLDERNGRELLGTYVYKEGVTGERHGYPDFYNKVLQEYNEAVDHIVYDPYSNVNINGTLTDTNGILTGFGSKNYAYTKDEVILDGDTWEAVVKFKLVDTATGDLTSNLLGTFDTTVSRMFNVDLYFGSIIYPRLSVSSNGTSWDIALNTYDSTYANTLTYGSEYLIKVYFDGTSYNLDLSSDDGLSWVNCIKVQSTTKIYNSGTIGFVYETSSSDDADIVSIDLNKSYIKNDSNIIWKGIADGGAIKKHSNGHLLYDISLKSKIDDIFNSTGHGWYYGIDTTYERIFLPRDEWFFQNTTYKDLVGNTNEAGLPNITGEIPIADRAIGGAGTGAFYSTNISNRWANWSEAGDGGALNHILDASRSNAIYGNSDTVQPESTNMLVYMVVGNIVSKKAITDVTDITSSENDTLPLFTSMYQSGEFSSAGWLKSDGDYKDGTVYKSAYEHLVNNLGVQDNIKEYGDISITDYDFVVNQEFVTFRLPLLDGSECIPDYNNEVSWGEPTEYKALPYNCFVWYSINSETTIDSAGFYYANEDETVVNEFRQALSYLRRGLGLFLPKGWKVKSLNSGSTLHIVPLTGNGSLYYKVGNAVQHLEVIDMLHQAELNNPYSFGDSKYSQIELNNSSWLASLGQWNSKGIYTDYYNWVLDNANESKEYFKLSTEEYTDYDWVINTTNETFRLPLKTKLASGSAVVGNDITLGLTDGVNYGGLLTNTTGNGLYGSGEYGVKVGTSTNENISPITGNIAMGITTDPTKSGIETSTDGLTLYFYVGEVVQSANLINAGRALEQIARMKVVVETYQNGTSWYRVYSDGWCEQGGRYTMATTGIGTIAFLKPFKDTNYNIFNCKTSTDASSWNVMFDVPTSWTTTGVTIKADLTGYTLSGSWYACGYIA